LHATFFDGESALQPESIDFTTLSGIAVGLAMDAFAVAITSSMILRGATARQTFRFAFHFGLFQFLMPVLGWTAGLTVEEWVAAWDHWVAFGLLFFIGGKSAISALRRHENEESGSDPTRGISLVVLSIATSIDALAVGFSFALLNVRIWYPSVVIGLVAAAFTTLGMQLGRRLGGLLGRPAELLGGLVLIGIGLKILAEHLSG
jgi:putative Mn2+ efflux pump MntP